MVYFKSGKKEEPYVTISRKISLKKGQKTPMELEIGQSERNLAAHRNAFKRTAVIQAFLGSTPQLTLQLYATIQEKYVQPIRCKNDWEIMMTMKSYVITTQMTVYIRVYILGKTLETAALVLQTVTHHFE